jgi:hypothetical protein
MNITERSSKDDIIGAACELADSQQSRIELLEGQQRIFLAVIITLAVKIFVF